ncbi:MAG: hypothetical protein WBZ36_18900 [Candidatus Nitrosopolaris sp.]
MVKVVEANEPDTINYEFCLNKYETSCVVNETYANSEAALVHAKGVASQTILPKIFNISRITRFDVYGDPSEDLQKALTSFGARLTIYLLDSVVNSLPMMLDSSLPLFLPNS